MREKNTLIPRLSTEKGKRTGWEEEGKREGKAIYFPTSKLCSVCIKPSHISIIDARRSALEEKKRTSGFGRKRICVIYRVGFLRASVLHILELLKFLSRRFALVVFSMFFLPPAVFFEIRERVSRDSGLSEPRVLKML